MIRLNIPIMFTKQKWFFSRYNYCNKLRNCPPGLLEIALAGGHFFDGTDRQLSRTSLQRFPFPSSSRCRKWLGELEDPALYSSFQPKDTKIRLQHLL